MYEGGGWTENGEFSVTGKSTFWPVDRPHRKKKKQKNIINKNKTLRREEKINIIVKMNCDMKGEKKWHIYIAPK